MGDNDLEKKLNFPNSPGRHSKLSPVVGVDAQAQEAIDKLSDGLPAI